MRTLPLLLAVLSTPVLAAPEVVRFDPNAPFNPATGFVDLVDFAPGAPDIRLSYFSADPGGGSNASVWYPQIVGAGWDPSGGNALEVESAVSPGAGTVVPSDTLGPWGVAHFDVFYGAPPDNYPLYRIAYEVFPFKDACLGCPYIESFLTMDDGIYYVGLRWEDGGQTYHGWAAFEVRHLEFPLDCIPGIDWACDQYDLKSLRRLRLRYLAAGWETEPDTPIVTGCGLCRADMNFDARFDFFDISEFLARFGANDPAADFTGEGNLDFFDVSAFITEYNAGCEF